MTISSSRDLILGSAGKRRYAKVDVEGLGTFWIRSLTEGERARIEKIMLEKAEHFRLSMIIACVVDEEGGDAVFGEADRQMLENVDSSITHPLGEAIIRHINERHVELDEQLKN